MARKRNEENKDKWWIKPPRSSRICFRCGHKYSSHIDCRCLKITQRKPTREECTCKGFIKDQQEMDMYNDRIKRREEKENMLLNDNLEN